MTRTEQKCGTGVLMDHSLMCREDQTLLQISSEHIAQSDVKLKPLLSFSCLWSKVWDPFPSLPPCVITHCVDPPDLPPQFSLAEDTSEWTEVGQTKDYTCIGGNRLQPSSLKSSDQVIGTGSRTVLRQLITFPVLRLEQSCLMESGQTVLRVCKSFSACNILSQSIADIICTEEPPTIPHDDEYNQSMEKDDGHLTVQHYIYPDLSSPYDGLHLSTLNQSEIPRNYMANLTFVNGINSPPALSLTNAGTTVALPECSVHQMELFITTTT